MEQKKKKWLLAGIAIGIVMLLGIFAVYPALNGMGGITGKSAAVKTNADYYEMFLCSCCNEPISTNCCGMAKERMDYVDGLLAKGLSEKEVLYEMVKKYGESVLADQSKIEEVKNYAKSNAPENPPKIELETERLNLGVVSQKDGIKTAEIRIRNAGKSDLIIDSMDTSCMCTSASIEYEGKEGPKFGMSMHGENPKDYRLSMPAGAQAVLRIYFDPNAHGPQKTPSEKLVREIIIVSNDPESFQKTLRIDIEQVP